MTRLNLQGKKFGWWQVLQVAPGRAKQTYWLARCRCGVEREVPTTGLRDGRTTSCGCKHKLQLAGTRVGLLLIVGRAAKAGYWNVRCDCGRAYAVYGGHLVQRRLKSCGCAKALPRESPLPQQRGTVALSLGCGKFALIDETDAAKANEHLWTLDASGYPRTRIDSKPVRLHRFLLGPAGKYVDHWDLNKLNNRRENLRKASGSQNLMNTGLTKSNATGFKGVSAYQNRWRARIRAHDVTTFLGYFQTKEEAARAYDTAARRLHGAFARLNFPTMNEQAARR